MEKFIDWYINWVLFLPLEACMCFSIRPLRLLGIPLFILWLPMLLISGILLFPIMLVDAGIQMYNE